MLPYSRLRSERRDLDTSQYSLPVATTRSKLQAPQAHIDGDRRRGHVSMRSSCTVLDEEARYKGRWGCTRDQGDVTRDQGGVNRWNRTEGDEDGRLSPPLLVPRLCLTGKMGQTKQHFCSVPSSGLQGVSDNNKERCSICPVRDVPMHTCSRWTLVSDTLSVLGINLPLRGL